MGLNFPLSCLLVVVGRPSAPNITLVSLRPTDITIKLSQADGEEVHTYNVLLTYLGPCSIEHSINTNKSSNEEFMITSLHEYSNYSISVIAINGAGQSLPANTSVVTSPSGKY